MLVHYFSKAKAATVKPICNEAHGLWKTMQPTQLKNKHMCVALGGNFMDQWIGNKT